jgi:hypothetical protein
LNGFGGLSLRPASSPKKCSGIVGSDDDIPLCSPFFNHEETAGACIGSPRWSGTFVIVSLKRELPMSSDKQFTALGPANVGFQTDGANIDVGADIHGSQAGIKGFCPVGDGVSGSGSVGVHGIAIRGDLVDGPGVLGESERGPGVSGSSRTSAGVSGNGTVGVLGSSGGEPALSSFGGSAGVLGTIGSFGPVLGPAGVVGTSSTVTGMAGSASLAPGVFGISSSPNHSSIHGQRGNGGRPVDRSAVLGTTDDTIGAGVSGSSLATFQRKNSRSKPLI